MVQSTHRRDVRKGGRRTRNELREGGRDAPLVSVIIPTRNSETSLPRCLDSVLAQTYPHVEIIVVDGASTDGTLDVLRAYDDRVDYWISEPDEGIYPAMNKGLDLARGELVGILGSDDRYRPDAIQHVVRAYREHPAAAGFMGHRAVEEADGKAWEKRPALSRRQIARGRFQYNHPATFFTAATHERLGDFDPRLPVAADGDLILRVIMSGGTIVTVPRVLTLVEPLGTSHVGGFSDLWRRLAEWRRMYRKNGVPFLTRTFALTLQTMRALRYLLLVKTLGPQRYARFRRRVGQA